MSFQNVPAGLWFADTAAAKIAIKHLTFYT